MRSVEDILLQLILKVTPSPIIVLHLVLWLHHYTLHHAILIMIIIMLPMSMILSVIMFRATHATHDLIRLHAAHASYQVSCCACYP